DYATMSSHHIVKEDQEPALIIAQMDGVSSSVLDQLLEWNPIVVTDADNLVPVIQRGIKVDVLVANESIDLPQDHVLILPITTSFLDTAVTYLMARGCRAANIVSTDMDPTLILLYAAEIDTVLLGNGKKIFAGKSGFSKWRPKVETVFLYDDLVADVSGLQRMGEREYITVADGFYSINFDKPYGLVGERI